MLNGIQDPMKFFIKLLFYEANMYPFRQVT